MGYSKRTWADGEVITAAKLNHMEDGIEDAGVQGIFVVGIDENDTLTSTWQEIYDAFTNNQLVICKGIEYDNIYIDLFWGIGMELDTYYIDGLVNGYSYFTNSSNGYPNRQGIK